MNNNLPKNKKISILLDKLTLILANKNIWVATFIIFLGLLVTTAFWFKSRYDIDNQMTVKLQELSNFEYPANPALLGKNFQRYTKRKLTIIKKDENNFDFVLEPTNEKTAKIVIKNVDLTLLVPKAPEWVKKDQGLEVIAFTNREWNRQQISFPTNSKNIEITGGDGFEKQNIVEIALANNCLNAGFWEILLFTKEDDNKTLYYQGWFTFPMGHYKNAFEKNNNMSYWKHWWKLEHWQDPSGTFVNTNLLRNVIDQKQIVAQFPLDEKIISAGEQSRKMRITLATNVTTWRDIYSGKHKIEFASFIQPGFYDPDKPWGNEYWRIGKFEKAVLRNIKPIGVQQNLQEIELVLGDTKTGEQNKLLISGINIQDIPQLPVKNYSKGLYMPLGIGIPPFFQSYEDLTKSHPDKSPYFSLLLDSKDRSIEHHSLGLAGVVMHRDENNPNLLHLYLLSYERSTLIAHFFLYLK
ncbi:hypothetical protein [Anabaena azotica]|uniref:hypothetical protein n=1 Tax=Anabaena azotica TaxID=197653 RepID=UPI0039A6FE51